MEDYRRILLAYQRTQKAYWIWIGHIKKVVMGLNTDSKLNAKIHKRIVRDFETPGIKKTYKDFKLYYHIMTVEEF